MTKKSDVETKPYIAWIACLETFAMWKNFEAFKAFRPAVDTVFCLANFEAQDHWVNGTALFGDNAIRIVSNQVAQQDGF